MLKNIVGVLILIAVTLAWMTWGIGVPNIYVEDIEQAGAPHLLGDPDRSIENIHIYAFYFNPKNRTTDILPNYKNILSQHLNTLTDFHALQFQNRSYVEYTIYPQPIVGLYDTIFYNTNDTSEGNSQALINIANELEDRVFIKGGDLYNADFLERKEGAYPVIFIFYSGVGASGGAIYESDLETAEEIASEFGVLESNVLIFNNEEGVAEGFFLLNKSFLTNTDNVTGITFLVHEFYHTLRIPDGYQIIDKNGKKHDISTSQDLMGLGRFKSIEQNYLSRDTLKQLGL